MQGVYVIRAIGTPRVKIGWSNNVEKRLNGLKTGCPYPVELLKVIETDDQSMERLAHEALRQFRVHGEWFELPNKTLAWLIEDGLVTKITVAQYLLTKDLEYAIPKEQAEKTRNTCITVLENAGIR